MTVKHETLCGGNNYRESCDIQLERRTETHSILTPPFDHETELILCPDVDALFKCSSKRIEHNRLLSKMSMSSRPFYQRLKKFISYERKSAAKKWLYFPVWQPQTPYEKLVPALPKNVAVPRKAPYLRMKFDFSADASRMNMAGKVSKLIKYERTELPWHQAVETRATVERLICEAVRYGPNHTATMELATFWLQEPNLVHKLFKVLVPRYANHTTSFTQLLKLAPLYEASTVTAHEVTKTQRIEAKKSPFFTKIDFAHHQGDRGVLELKGEYACSM